MKNIMIKFTVGIKIKKKKKFRKWQKNSGAIFEKGGAIMGWENVIKNAQDERIQEIQDLVSEIKENEFYDEAVRISGPYTFRSHIITNNILDDKVGIKEALYNNITKAKPELEGIDYEDIPEPLLNRSFREIRDMLSSLNKALKNYPTRLNKMQAAYERLISHPEWDEKYLDNSEASKLKVGSFHEGVAKIFRGLNQGEINEKTPVKDFVDFYVDGPKRRDIIRIENAIIAATRDFSTIYSRLSLSRSMGFFEDMGKTMGVEIKQDQRGNPSFDHGGLTFSFEGKTSLVINGGPTRVSVCVVSRNKSLPIGDYYAQLLGMVVARPTELDVVDFGIQLANIFKKYENYWGQFTRAKSGIIIYTPFSRDNTENVTFMGLIDFLYVLTQGNIYEADPEIAKELLQEIEGALMDSFGSTRGFL
tara:strand:- start:4395 stop:5651 length:1257 start_codon:yes stop_codon:yes gene_type:complete